MKTREKVVTVEGVDGEELEVGLRFDFNAAERIHSELGINLLAEDGGLAPEEREKAMGPGQIVAMVYAFYCAYWDAREEDPPISLRKFGALDVAGLYDQVREVRAANMPEPDEGEAEEATDGGNPRPAVEAATTH